MGLKRTFKRRKHLPHTTIKEWGFDELFEKIKLLLKKGRLK
jgi:hypothetical protein